MYFLVCSGITKPKNGSHGWAATAGASHSFTAADGAAESAWAGSAEWAVSSEGDDVARGAALSEGAGASGEAAVSEWAGAVGEAAAGEAWADAACGDVEPVTGSGSSTISKSPYDDALVLPGVSSVFILTSGWSRVCISINRARHSVGLRSCAVVNR